MVLNNIKIRVNKLSFKYITGPAHAHLTMLQCHYHHQRVINDQTSHEDHQKNKRMPSLMNPDSPWYTKREMLMVVPSNDESQQYVVHLPEADPFGQTIPMVK